MNYESPPPATEAGFFVSMGEEMTGTEHENVIEAAAGGPLPDLAPDSPDGTPPGPAAVAGFRTADRPAGKPKRRPTITVRRLRRIVTEGKQ